jgi:3-oxoacyl-[acyl-carrier protein] reductase
VADEAAVNQAFASITARFGRLDVLVNNACAAKYEFVLEMSARDWDEAIAACLRSVFLCSRAAARFMHRQRSGKIVNISSMAARIGLARTSAYAAAKGGVEAMTRVMAVELAPFNVQVNALAPGPIDTEFSRRSLPDVVRAARLRRTPAGRFGTPEEVAATVSFMCSPAASWMTGAVVALDGGYTVAGSGSEQMDAANQNG